MADISITGSAVLPTSGTTIIDSSGVAGEALTAGDAVYLFSTGPNTYKHAGCAVALGNAAANLVGMVMNPAVTGQPVSIGVGRITIAASGLTVGQQFNLSANVGKFAPVADIATTNNVVAGGWVMSATDVMVAPKVCGVLHV